MLGADAPADLGGKALEKVVLIRVFGRPPDPLVDAPRIPADEDTPAIRLHPLEDDGCASAALVGAS